MTTTQPPTTPQLGSGIGRPIDLRYPSNRFVVAATVVAGAIGFLFGDGNAFSDGVTAGGAVFLAWAIGRELDPDSTWSAGVAAPIALALWFIHPPGLAITGAVLLVLRIVARTTGRSPALVDMVVVGGFAAFTAWRPGGVIAASAIGVALVLDCVLARRNDPVQYGAGLATVLAAGVVATGWAQPLDFTDPTAGWIVLVAVAVAAGATMPLGSVRSVGDLTGEPLSASRVRLARLVAAVVVIGYAALGGSAGLETVAPAVAAMVALPVGKVRPG